MTNSMDKVENIVDRLREQHKHGIMGLPENWIYVHYGEAADLIQSQQALIEEMRGALEASHVALDDWLNVYASDMCDPARVREAHDRVGSGGTISYVAHVTAKIRKALSQKE